MTSLNVAVDPFRDPAGESSLGVKDSSVSNNLSSVGSVPVCQDSASRNTTVVGPCPCCANTPIQHSGVGSFLVDGEIPGETTTE